MSADSLRYYESIGLIHPARSDSGYRLYSITDLWKLNVIKDMRKMNFSFSKIKDYFTNRTIESTRQFLVDRVEAIDLEIQTLNQLKNDIKQRLTNIDTYAEMQVTSKIILCHFDRRKCIDISTQISKPEQIDLGFRELQMKSKDVLNLMGNKDLCVYMSIEKIRAHQPDFYQGVFCFVEDDAPFHDFVLEAGDFLCVTYRGPHDQSAVYAELIIDHALANGYEILGLPIEVCLIDVHDTSNKEEYVTEIQMPVAVI